MSRPSEDDLIAKYFAPLAGPGGLGLRDDAALIRPKSGHDLVVTKDMLIAGGHFFPNDPPEAVARKALRVNLSDLAAKGATPVGFLLGLALPTDWTEIWLERFVAGLADDAAAFQCPLLGGDTVATAGPLTLTVSAFGEVVEGHMCRRTGTRPGDLVYVSGTIGDAALGLALRQGHLPSIDTGTAEYLLQRYLLPQPRLALQPALAHARAGMDVSDGFIGDLEKMLRLEGLTMTVEAAAVPLSPAAQVVIECAPKLLTNVLTGGDDYEILTAVPPEDAQAFEAAAGAVGIKVTCLGAAERGDTLVIVRDATGAPLKLGPGRFQHFA